MFDVASLVEEPEAIGEAFDVDFDCRGSGPLLVWGTPNATRIAARNTTMALLAQDIYQYGQLGLKLARSRGDVRKLIIDHVEQPSEN